MKDNGHGCVTKFVALVCAATVVGVFLYAIYLLLGI